MNKYLEEAKILEEAIRTKNTDYRAVIECYKLKSKGLQYEIDLKRKKQEEEFEQIRREFDEKRKQH